MNANVDVDSEVSFILLNHINNCHFLRQDIRQPFIRSYQLFRLYYVRSIKLPPKDAYQEKIYTMSWHANNCFDFFSVNLRSSHLQKLITGFYWRTVRCNRNYRSRIFSVIRISSFTMIIIAFPIKRRQNKTPRRSRRISSGIETSRRAGEKCQLSTIPSQFCSRDERTNG